MNRSLTDQRWSTYPARRSMPICSLCSSQSQSSFALSRGKYARFGRRQDIEIKGKQNERERRRKTNHRPAETLDGGAPSSGRASASSTGSKRITGDCKISIGRAHTEPRLTGHCASRHLSPSLSLVVLFPCSTQTIYQHISNKYITILCNENFIDQFCIKI